MMYGRPSSLSTLPVPADFDSSSYPAILNSKLAQLADIVEIEVAAEAQKQKFHQDRHSGQGRTFAVGDLAWLSRPTAGKLEARWSGDRIVLKAHGDATYIQSLTGCNRKLFMLIGCNDESNPQSWLHMPLCPCPLCHGNLQLLIIT